MVWATKDHLFSMYRALTISMRLVLLYSAVCLSDAFTVHRPFCCHNNRRPNPNHLASLLARHLPDPSSPCPTSSFHMSAVDSDAHHNDSPIELWLDLRDTAILPHAALEHMEENQWVGALFSMSSDSMKPRVDRVLISGSDVAQVVKQMSRNDDRMPEILYVDNQDIIRSVQDPTQILGGVVSLADDEFTDPLPALDILSGGGWVVIDSECILDEDKRDQSVGGLVDFLSAGASSSASSSSLLLGADKGDKEDVESPESGNKGGIALSCANKYDVLRAGTYQSIISSDSLSTTDGGVLIQTRTDDTDDVATLSVAVAVPFDAILWKACALIFGVGDVKE